VISLVSAPFGGGHSWTPLDTVGRFLLHVCCTRNSLDAATRSCQRRRVEALKGGPGADCLGPSGVIEEADVPRAEVTRVCPMNQPGIIPSSACKRGPVHLWARPERHLFRHLMRSGGLIGDGESLIRSAGCNETPARGAYFDRRVADLPGFSPGRPAGYVRLPQERSEKALGHSRLRAFSTDESRRGQTRSEDGCRLRLGGESDGGSTTDEGVRKSISGSVRIRRKESSKATEPSGVLGSITALSSNCGCH
jgi:hypothetical protein